MTITKALADLHKDGQRCLITIDGPCGSGKTTLAAALSEQLGIPCVHMDDFYVPHARKTPERLSIPGGNADVERFMVEFLTPWISGEHAIYQPYDPFADAYKPSIDLPACTCLILEGSYANLPEIRRHAALRIWLTISPETQQQRILLRNGAERLAMFNRRWIPLEQAYHAAYSLPDAGCLVLSGE